MLGTAWARSMQAAHVAPKGCLRIVGRQYATAADYVAKHTRAKGAPISERDAARSPGLQTLAARLALQDIPSATLARTLVSDTSSLKYVNNAGLAKFGRTLLSFFVYEHFMAKYPRLPPPILKHLVKVYSGNHTLSELARNWGVQTDTRTPLARYLADVSDEQALGRLAYSEQNEVVEKGVTEIISKGTTTQSDAMGVFVRALVGAIYAHRGLEGTRKFVQNYIIRPRKIDLLAIMSFSRPTRELAVLCAREGLEPPVSRLMAESGRYSSTPVFVVGVFCGAQKVGEGQGSSLNEARTRAAVNALQAWYLYSPVGETSDVYVDPGQIVI